VSPYSRPCSPVVGTAARAPARAHAVAPRLRLHTIRSVGAAKCLRRTLAKHKRAEAPSATSNADLDTTTGRASSMWRTIAHMRWPKSPGLAPIVAPAGCRRWSAGAQASASAAMRRVRGRCDVMACCSGFHSANRAARPYERTRLGRIGKTTQIERQRYRSLPPTPSFRAFTLAPPSVPTPRLRQIAET
jgi:hypothetical protein